MSDQSVVLLVDDRDEDILLTRRAFQIGGIPNPLFWVYSGDDAIAYLSGVGKYSNRGEYPCPT